MDKQPTKLDTINRRIAQMDELIANKRYCPMCEKWVPMRQTECKACGMPTDRWTR
jgi:rRNA maturation endonuclease Nob1